MNTENLNEMTNEVETTEIEMTNDVQVVGEVEQTNELQKNYELEGTEKLLSVIPSLNYMRLMNLKNDMEKELSNLESAKSILDSLENMETVDDLGKKVAIANIMNDKEYQTDSVAFKNTFDSNKDKLIVILNALNEELKKYDDIQKGTKFYTGLYISNLEEIMPKLSNDPNNLKPYECALDAFKNRTSIDFILNYTKDYKICDIKMEVIKNVYKCMDKYERAFSTLFNKDQFTIFERYITEKFENNERAIETFLSSLGRTIIREKESGKYNYVKVFVMNILDIVNDVYDLEGGKEDFENKVLELYRKYK